MKKIISLIILISFIVFSNYAAAFALAATNDVSIKIPEIASESKTIGIKLLKGFPYLVKQTFAEMGDWIKNLWDFYIYPGLNYIWRFLVNFIKKEVKKRWPGIKQEFKKERREMRQEIPSTGKSIWERFKELTE